MKNLIDLRSDTVTSPTPEMRRAMAEAEVGDDVYGEDPTVNRLQERAAEILGKEAALFVPTGTMGNQIAVKLHTKPGQEVVMEERGHIFNYEMATMAAFSGCLARPVRGEKGHLKWSQIEAVLSPDVYYRASTGLIALENTHNMAGGTVMTQEATDEIASQVHAQGLPVHLDGARIFNAAVALGSTVAELSRHCDSVMFCLSKGLSAPVGSILLGTRDFIKEAWRVRKMMGGGMRQVGVLAAAGFVSLEQMPLRLHEDHENARLLAEAFHELDGFQVDLESVQTNIVMVNLEQMSSIEFLGQLKENGILAGPTGPHQVRFVTHKDVTRDDIGKTIESIRRLKGVRA
ncbi:aminotransferase class I/II-fold pyridoxal phosphate-dependent enzyme [Acidobacteria bacterium AH-259-O06]|nr:aminotransferase class I/II-fold pyridoxal phosphate-dependent enzyme [Acidobacteria bacterium AH-259-O06]